MGHMDMVGIIYEEMGGYFFYILFIFFIEVFVQENCNCESV